MIVPVSGLDGGVRMDRRGFLGTGLTAAALAAFSQPARAEIAPDSGDFCRLDQWGAKPSPRIA